MTRVKGFQVAGDLALTADDTDFALLAGAEMALQQIRAGAEIWQGTISWDPEAGLPMIDGILVKGPDLRVIQQVFRDFLLATDGVASVEKVVVAFDRQARKIEVNFRATAEDGSALDDVLSFTAVG